MVAGAVLSIVTASVLVVLEAGRALHAPRAATQASAATASPKHHALVPPVPLRPRSRVSVLVLNGNGASGVAGATAAQLLGRGYRSATATNASNRDYATSLVLYRRGWAGEAERLARDSGIRVVSPLDGLPPAGSRRYQLVLILGAN